MQRIKFDCCSHVPVMAIYLKEKKENRKKWSGRSEKKHLKAQMYYMSHDEYINF